MFFYNCFQALSTREHGINCRKVEKTEFDEELDKRGIEGAIEWFNTISNVKLWVRD